MHHVQGEFPVGIFRARAGIAEDTGLLTVAGAVHADEAFRLKALKQVHKSLVFGLHRLPVKFACRSNSADLGHLPFKTTEYPAECTASW